MSLQRTKTKQNKEKKTKKNKNKKKKRHNNVNWLKWLLPNWMSPTKEASVQSDKHRFVRWLDSVMNCLPYNNLNVYSIID